MLYIAEREELGVDMSIEQIVVNTVKGRHKEPEHLARNPFGTVPALELDDGTYLVESLAMIDFLEDKFPNNTMYQGTPEEKGKARDMERVIDLRLGGPMGAFGHATNSPLGRPPEPEKAAQYLESMQTPLNYLETLLGDGRPLLCGDHVNVADCTLQSFLQFTRFVEADVFGDRPLLRAWDARYRARPAAQAVLKW
jgi:glutathione S-transferase